MPQFRTTAIAFAILASVPLAGCLGGGGRAVEEATPPLAGPAAATVDLRAPVDVSRMQAFCADQAVTRFTVPLQLVVTHIPEAAGAAYTVHGDYTRLDGSPTARFSCSFGSDRVFQSIQAV